jgi:hypothetical protein
MIHWLIMWTAETKLPPLGLAYRENEGADVWD